MYKIFMILQIEIRLRLYIIKLCDLGYIWILWTYVH
jgi:hypothetical protein